MNSPLVKSNLNFLRQVVQSITSRNLALVITLMPESPLYAQTDYFGKYGPSRAAGRALVDSLQSICAMSPLCRIYDVNRAGNHDYTADEAINEDHLSTAGSEKFTPRLDSVLTEVIKARQP